LKSTLTLTFRIIALILLLMFIGAYQPIFAQIAAFTQNTSVQVIGNGNYLQHPWAGGLHNPQFSAIDLNADGVQDLFVFDKINNHVLTFINNGAAGQTDYTYAPEYARFFPDELHDWAVLTDYTDDGLPDIFTYGLAGISVYKAHRQLPDDTLYFTLASEQLRFSSFSGSLNILSNGSELPAFIDVNNDGDIDVLTFDFIGKYVEYYENKSIELTGTPYDTLWFSRITPCWGKFSESNNTNAIILNDDCGGGLPPAPALPHALRQMHSGSTLLALDLNNDSAKELLIGDVSFGNLIMLQNGGTPDEALITGADENFPSYDVPVNLPVFPAAFYLDVNNDGKNDLIATINERNNATSQNHVWLYQNTGTAQNPVFTHLTNEFLLNEMIDVGVRSYPALIDYNSDGLTDIIIGNLGNYQQSAATYVASLTLLQNTGTPTLPRFNLITTNFANLQSYGFRGLYPAFGDLDNDGDPDMLAADELGFLHYFENTAPPGSPMQLSYTMPNLLEVPGADAVTPCLFDIDSDGFLDLLCGERAGKLNYYRNTTPETGSLSFSQVSNFWGAVDVRQFGFPYGYSAPALVTIDSTGQTYLFVNSESGRIHVYTDLDQPVFTLVDNHLSHINQGGRGGLTLADINQNNSLDMLVGNFRGGIALYSQAGTPTDTTGIGLQDLFFSAAANNTLHIYPTPTLQNSFNLLLPAPALAQNLQVVIYNLQGLLIQAKVTPLYSAPSSGMAKELWVELAPQTPPGIYFVQVQTPAFTAQGKVLVKK